MPVALYALTAGAFGIGVTEFVIMGLLLEVSRELGVSIVAAGMLISSPHLRPAGRASRC
jgi:DHA1 family inner membrane transport protein